jgi:hypothetical protein
LGISRSFPAQAPNARLVADVVLAMLANSMTTSFVRSLLDVRDGGGSKKLGDREKLERFVVGLRVVATILDDDSGFAVHAVTTRVNAALAGGMGQVQHDVRGFFLASAPEMLSKALDQLMDKEDAFCFDAGGAPRSVLSGKSSLKPRREVDETKSEAKVDDPRSGGALSRQ